MKCSTLITVTTKSQWDETEDNLDKLTEIFGEDLNFRVVHDDSAREETRRSTHFPKGRVVSYNPEIRFTVGQCKSGVIEQGTTAKQQ